MGCRGHVPCRIGHSVGCTGHIVVAAATEHWVMAPGVAHCVSMLGHDVSSRGQKVTSTGQIVRTPVMPFGQTVTTLLLHSVGKMPHLVAASGHSV